MIVCIGREFGSGGHEIGRKVAEKLGLELYDRDLIDRAAEKIVAMPKDVLEKADEKKRNPWLHEVWYDVPNQELNGMTANDKIKKSYKKGEKLTDDYVKGNDAYRIVKGSAYWDYDAKCYKYRIGAY